MKTMQCHQCGVTFDVLQATKHEHVFEDSPSSSYGTNVVCLACPTCRTLHVILTRGQILMEDANWVMGKDDSLEVIYPRIKKVTFVDGVPKEYGEILSQIYAIHNISPNAAATLCRRLLQRILRVSLEISPQSRIQEEIDTFLSKIDYEASEYLRNGLHALRQFGNAGAHPSASDEDRQVSIADAKLMGETIEAFIRLRIEQPLQEAAYMEKISRSRRGK